MRHSSYRLGQSLKSHMWLLEAATVLLMILWITVQFIQHRAQDDALVDLSARLDAMAVEHQQALDELATPLVLLLGAMAVDYITGLMAAKNRGESINSYKGINGIFKKFCYLLLVIVGVGLDCLVVYCRDILGLTFGWSVVIAAVLAVWLVVNEVVSILENIQDITGSLPPWLLPLVKNIRSKVESTVPNTETEENSDG